MDSGKVISKILTEFVDIEPIENCGPHPEIGAEVVISQDQAGGLPEGMLGKWLVSCVANGGNISLRRDTFISSDNAESD